MKVTAIFDIGKTNKKFFLFDENYNIVLKESISFDEILDEDGFTADNLPAIEEWIKNILRRIINDPQFEISAINFSAYGASFVHVDENGKPVTALYNYLKPYPENISQSFFNKYDKEKTIAAETGSPFSGMLNSGLQLYWLKYAKPDIFKKIKWSMHLPQYFSYLLTGVPVSDHTSIGCHTSLWNYKKKDYHHWVYEENIDKILPDIASSDKIFQTTFDGKAINVGAGIHDSSGALLPYILADKKPFVLLSTGTWSISLNPFSEEFLTETDMENNCLNYMRTDGKPVRAARLFLGREHEVQAQLLCEHFKKEKDYHQHIKFNQVILEKLKSNYSICYRFENINLDNVQPLATSYERFLNFEEAYHQLIIELSELQMKSTKLAIGNTAIHKIYVDGGFADNDIYIKLLERNFPHCEIIIAQSPIGSALGAAMITSK